MARSQYIYFVRRIAKCDATLISAHTVKHEAHTWVRRSDHKFSEVRLTRMRDGIWRGKDEVDVEWELEDDDE